MKTKVLPQTWLAKLLLKKFKTIRTEQFKTATIYWLEGFNGGISLGDYILIDETWKNVPFIKEHEYGHTLQSYRLGFFYLFIVGIPSITMNIISQFNKKFGDGEYAKNYYNRWPENEADRLAGVDRVNNKVHLV